MSIDPENDSRPEGPWLGDERAVLVGFLRWQRATLELKCAGLDAAELARRSVEPSALSLLGLVRHMAEVERNWFRNVMAGQDAPPHFLTEEDHNLDFDGVAPNAAMVAEAWDAWRSEVAFAEQFVAEAPDWYAYDLPAVVAGRAWRGRYRGQTQKWFAFRFTGPDSEIDIAHPGGGRHRPEFDAWRWEPMRNLPRLIIPFKRPVYEQVIAAFRHLGV